MGELLLSGEGEVRVPEERRELNEDHAHLQRDEVEVEKVDHGPELDARGPDAEPVALACIHSVRRRVAFEHSQTHEDEGVEAGREERLIYGESLERHELGRTGANLLKHDEPTIETGRDDSSCKDDESCGAQGVVILQGALLDPELRNDVTRARDRA
ncbi:hypothetical protein PMAYCL1PPCAC_00627 [Pristionchus mayeri]|uniref:Uncharacterized protein n=1 Tax=Pristionchus mayeri TaxID=1317129 RepID=A0AAN4Z2Z4_9BILA|nr:hypothetical protein PMAYCL1PPCAC_00627 [Pristionchus mayeri]